MDLRIERTYRSLISAFEELLEQSHYEDITISALCDKAMIRRTTFYKHFADKDEFFIFFLRSLREEFELHSQSEIASSQKKTTDNSEFLLLKELIAFLDNHEQLVSNLLQSRASGALIDMMANVLEREIVNQLADNSVFASYSLVDLSIRAQFISGGVIRTLQQWIVKNKQRDIEAELKVLLIPLMTA